MAILIERDINVMGAIPIDQIYIRVQYIADLSGKALICQAYPYYDKNSFLSNSHGNALSIDGLKTYYEFPYDNYLNGENPLTYIHEKIKEVLSTDIYTSQAVLDPSTGFPTFDPSTGEQITEQVIITPKFAEDSSISFVDLD